MTATTCQNCTYPYNLCAEAKDLLAQVTAQYTRVNILARSEHGFPSRYAYGNTSTQDDLTEARKTYHALLRAFWKHFLPQRVVA